MKDNTFEDISGYSNFSFKDKNNVLGTGPDRMILSFEFGSYTGAYDV